MELIAFHLQGFHQALKFSLQWNFCCFGLCSKITSMYFINQFNFRFLEIVKRYKLKVIVQYYSGNIYSTSQLMNSIQQIFMFYGLDDKIFSLFYIKIINSQSSKENCTFIVPELLSVVPTQRYMACLVYFIHLYPFIHEIMLLYVVIVRVVFLDYAQYANLCLDQWSPKYGLRNDQSVLLLQKKKCFICCNIYN